MLEGVDESFAYDEGAGDRTLARWRAGHVRYRKRATERLGFEWTPDLEIVLERFDIVWPRSSPTEAPAAAAAHRGLPAASARNPLEGR